MNKLFAILIICSLALPVLATDVPEQISEPVKAENLEVLTAEEVEELSAKSVGEIDSSIIPESLPNRFKKPVGKKKLAKKFMIAMLCVAGTSIFLYGTLSVYNKLRDVLNTAKVVPPEGEQPLETPCDLTDAVKTFIDKTRWDN